MNAAPFLRRRTLPLAVLALYLLLAGWMARAEFVWTNEAWFASPALNLIHRGYLGTTIFESKGTWLEGLDRHTYWIPPLYPLLQSLWYRLFGFSLTVMRWLSIAAGAVLLLAWYEVWKRLGISRAVALTALAIAATDVRFLTFAELGRPDVLCAALGTLGWATYLRWRERSLLLAILAGNALAATACMAHACGTLYAAGLLLLTIYFDRRRLRWPALPCIAAPYLGVLAAWGLYILQAPSQFRTQFVGNINGIGREFTGVSRLQGLASPLAGLKAELTFRYGAVFGRFAADRADRVALLALGIYVMAVAACVLLPSIRRQSGYRALLLLGALDYLLLGVFDGFKSSGYVIHTLPVVCACLAICLHSLFARSGRKLVAAGLAAAILLFAALQGNALYRGLCVTPERWDYAHAVAFVRSTGAAPHMIAGGEFAFEFGFDSGMVDDLRLGYFTGRRAPLIVANTIYQGWFEHSATLAPAIHAYMSRLLRDEYRMVFHNSSYTIYQAVPER